MKEILVKYKIAIFIILITFIIAVIGIVIYLFKDNKIKIKEYKNEIYKVKYDSTWSIKSKANDNLVLSYNKDISLEFNIINLEKDYLYMSIEEVLEQLEYSIKEQNKNYGLIGRQEILVTKSGYLGYQLLYEDKDNEVMVIVAKKGEQLLVVTYEAPYDNFDILLDSVKEIIYNFELFDVEYEIENKIEGIEFEELSLKSDSKIKANTTFNYSFSKSNYLVELEIPNIFVSSAFYSNWAYFREEEKKITLSGNVYKQNVYELLENIKIGNSFIVNNKYDGKKDSYTKINDNEYIYYLKYTSESLGTKAEYEYVYMIYGLGKDRVLVITLEARNETIPKEIVENIKLKNSTRYAKNIYRTIEDGNLINEMKYVHNTYTNPKKYSIITLYTPERYQEMDYDHDKYEFRYFGDLYNENTNEYNLNVDYRFVYNINDSLKSLEDYDFKDAAKKAIGIKKYHNKDFDIYYYEYKKNNVNHYSYVLYHQLEGGKLLLISIKSNKKISDQYLKDITNFKIETLTMNN
jgi:hypothetical protein